MAPPAAGHAPSAGMVPNTMTESLPSRGMSDPTTDPRRGNSHEPDLGGELEAEQLATEATLPQSVQPGTDGSAWVQEPWLAEVEAIAAGLEIGPLHTPRFPRERYPNIRYVDHASTDDLREKYATDAFMVDHLDEIVDVDVVWDGSAPLLEALRTGLATEAPVDFVFASHVIEHAPDMIGWLQQIGQVLDDGGRLCLAIPDKRLCFDVNRDLTTMADLVDAHLRGLSAPDFRQIYDFHSRIIDVDAAALWAGTIDYAGTWRADLDPDEWAYELCLKHQQTGEYVDGHCQVFTPGSFIDVYARMAKLGLIDYRIAAFHPSVLGTIEFRVVLEKLPSTMGADERRAAQLDSIPDFDDPVPAYSADRADGSGSIEDGPAEGALRLDVSPREESLILAKRRAIEKARGLLGWARRRE
jgi:hypothetical protein